MMSATRLAVFASVLLSADVFADAIRGCVVDTEGRPVASARVEAWDYTPVMERRSESSVKVAETISDSRGRFTISAPSLRHVALIARGDDQIGITKIPPKHPVVIVIGANQTLLK